MARVSKSERIELVKKLNWLERKNKHNSTWDSQVKLAFEASGSFSFDELIHKGKDKVEVLIKQFS